VVRLEHYEASDYYKEFMNKHNYYHEMVITFYSRNKFNGVLGIAKDKSLKGFSHKDRTIFQTLAPIISNLLYLEREYEEQRKEKEMFEAFADKNTSGFILLDQNYRVIYMNQAALRIYKETSIYKNIESFIEDIAFVPRNRLNGPPMLHLQGYQTKVITHQEKFLSKESHFAVIIEEHQVKFPVNDDKYLNKLTKREKEVCFYLKNGCTYKEIAEKLVISIHTVNKHVKSIYQKLEVTSRASLQAKLLNLNFGNTD
jgi:DNA-binding CsgD family transcriptional regulator